MIKVVLIDDEPFHLVGMRTIIPWEQYHCMIVGDARSGADGIELIMREKPDIAIVDILMPGMDGLEMIRRVRNLRQAPRFIVLSCMNDIQRYKEAMQLGVSEYLQKELVTPDILGEVLVRIGSELRSNQGDDFDREHRLYQTGYSASAEYLYQLMTGETVSPDSARQLSEWGLLPRGSAYRVAVISVKNLYTVGTVQQRTIQSVVSICQEILCREGSSFLFRLPDGRLAGLLPPLAEEQAQRYFERVRFTVEQGVDCTITMGLSQVSDQVEQLPERFRQACQGEAAQYYLGSGQLYCFPLEAVVAPERLQNKFVAALPDSAQVLHLQLDALCAELMQQRPKQEFAQSRLSAFVQYMKMFLEQKGSVSPELELEFSSVTHRCYSLDSLKETEQAIRTLINDMESAKTPRQTERLITEVKAYIQRHLDERIRLTQIGAAVYMSPSYLSRLFKQETGVNLNDYIRAEKVRRSKELLREKSVNEVAECLGYSSISYFVSMFKELTGVTPYQYKLTIEHGK